MWSISIGKGILTLISVLHPFDLRIEFFSLYFREELGIIQSIEWIEKPRSKWEICHPSTCNNRTCPWSPSCLIDTHNIVFFHGMDCREKLLFSKFSLLSERSHEPRARYTLSEARKTIGERKVWTSSERRRANGSGLLVYLKRQIRTVSQRQYYPPRRKKVKSHLVYSSSSYDSFVVKEKMLQMDPLELARAKDGVINPLWCKRNGTGVGNGFRNSQYSYTLLEPWGDSWPR